MFMFLPYDMPCMLYMVFFCIFLDLDPLLSLYMWKYMSSFFFRVLSYARITYMFRVWQGDDLVRDKK
ncbi:hypothetical protein MtrunA17_Chr3g0108921 [Medicago truncatula]|uniref:Transmembrane protein n=1 Tax=Medicago truncatula TaxID=3880 RepID=A0A396IQH6_MEDTR|nr:hypothetical protein MtrunA17_Chr3g0108921 [Medicago truncatula]